MISDTPLDYGPQLKSHILDAFKGNIEPIPIQFSYRISLVLITLVMVLLPLIYIALIAGFAYGLFYYAVHLPEYIQSVRIGYWTIIMLATPVVIGSLSLLFMIKPLFAGERLDGEEILLTAEEEPLLFAFVGRLTQAVGAPFPKVIAIDPEVNASASFYGFKGFFANELRLTLGMPLVAGLSLNQFAGVLAHEFGHFAQSAGMRLTYIVRSINYWFLRVVYERDIWDQRLDQWIAESESLFILALKLAQGMVWLTRRILWLLMRLGHIVSNLMLRQMEFDADRYETRLVGSDVFASTAHELNYLGWSHHVAHREQQELYTHGKLCDNLCSLVMFHRGRIDEQTTSQLNKRLEEGNTSLDDTHPCDRDRIANARKETATPVLDVDMPATILFRDFDKASARITETLYREILGSNWEPKMLHHIDDLKAHMQLEDLSREAFVRFFDVSLTPWHCPRLTGVADLPKTRQAARESFMGLRKAIEELRPQARQAAPGYLVAMHRLRLREQAFVLVDNDIQIDASSFEVPSADKQKIEEMIGQSTAKLGEVAAPLNEFVSLNSHRLSLALALLHKAEIQKRIADENGLLADFGLFRDTLEGLQAQSDALEEIRRERAHLEGALHGFSASEVSDVLRFDVKERTARLSTLVNVFVEALENLKFPFHHIDPEMTVGKFILAQRADKSNPAQTFEVSTTLIGNLLSLRLRLMGRVALLAEAVEKLFGLEPVEPEPIDAQFWNWEY